MTVAAGSATRYPPATPKPASSLKVAAVADPGGT